MRRGLLLRYKAGLLHTQARTAELSNGLLLLLRMKREATYLDFEVRRAASLDLFWISDVESHLNADERRRRSRNSRLKDEAVQTAP